MSWKSTLHRRVSLKLWHKERSVLSKRSFELYFAAINIYLDKVAMWKLHWEKWIWFSVLGIVPQGSRWWFLELNVVLWCHCASDRGKPGRYSRIWVQYSPFVITGTWVYVCVHFHFKLELLCQSWNINKLISFGAPLPKDAERTISFQIYFTCIFQPV